MLTSMLVAASLMLAASTIGARAESATNDETSEAKKMELPLKARDLATDDIYVCSIAGSHTCLRTDRKLPGIPRMDYRQFSDWDHGGHLFDPVLDIELIGTNGKPVRAEKLDYVWRPDFVRSRFKFGNLAEAEQVLAAVDEETFILQFRLKPLTGQSLEIKTSGVVSQYAQTTITETPGQGFKFDIHTMLKNLGDSPPSKLDKTYTLTFSQTPSSLSVDGQKYAAEFKTNGGQELTLVVAFSGNSDPLKTRQYLADPSKAISRTTREVDSWLAELRKPTMKDPHEVQMYYRAWYQFWHNIEHAEGYWTRPILTPSKSGYTRGVWLWDTGFHIMALVQGGKRSVQLAADQVRVLVNGAKEVHHLPREVWVGFASPATQPPGILTWAAMEIYARSKDKQFLEDIYPGLAQNNKWFYTDRDSNKNGLAEWSGADSGWDSSPRWDKGAVDAVDLNSWLYLDQIKLAEMCEILGKSDEAKSWRVQAATTAKTVREKMWDEEAGCYWDLSPSSGKPMKLLTPAIFWPMFTGIATKEEAARLVQYLEPGKGLWTTYPMPCVSELEPTYDPKDYWRGSVWINVNWLTCLGLERYGYNDLAAKLRQKSIEVVAKNAMPAEYYDPRDGKGLGIQNFMWTGALYIVMCNEAADRARGK